jgi:hypothetical protein
MSAPRYIPEHMKKDFTLNGRIPIFDWYINEVVPEKTITWSNEYLQSFIDSFTLENIRSGKNYKDTYFNGAKLHLEAFEKHIDVLKNKKVAVIGSQSPWIEAILVNCGVREVTTVEYNVPQCNHDVIKTISYDDFSNSSETYDAIVSYSSIEHSGLGRYGDPLNPNADIETMEKIYSSLNQGGLCFLGVPVGRDYLVWNAHRIYGKLRLKLMYLNKFKELQWVGCNKSYIEMYRLPISTGNPRYDIQPVIILQK